MQSLKARVFISCGQRSDKEKALGSACQRYLNDERGFSVYLAEEVQSLEALTENIFRHLRNSEYAVFIDCAREELTPGEFRGSVFVNQELAIAAFLPIQDCRVFHEMGVAREGIVEHLIAKPVQFTTEQGLMEKLKEETKEWESGWRHELSLEFLGVVPDVRDQSGNHADWYHLQVVNNHRDKYARNCIGYVSNVRNLDRGDEVPMGTFELAWAGTRLFERHILPKASAEIDAFFVVRGQDIIRFHHRPSTSSQYGMPPLLRGNYLLTYVIVSENFEQVTKTFKLEFGGNYEEIKFSACDTRGTL